MGQTCKSRFLIKSFIVIFMSTLIGCYSFKGISIPNDVNTFNVENFQLSSSASAAPADLSQRFSEGLRTKIRSESRLKYNTNGPDVEFSGTIEGFNIRPEAPIAGNTVALNKFEIIINVTFVNNKDESQNWKNSFSFFRTFASDQDFLSVQDGLINEIFKQLYEDVFNKAFTSW
jgi:Lipopolysaccharide-assembly